MGCCESNFALSPEEHAISLHVGAFFFAGKSSRDIEFAIRRYSRDGVLTVPQVQAALKGAGISLSGEQATAAWDRMKVDAEFPEGRLIAAAMLLGDGDTETKGTIICDFCDPSMFGSANRQLFYEHIEDIIFVATQVIPFVAIGTGEHKVKLEQMSAYLGNIKRIVPNAQEILTEKVFGNLESVTKQEFVRKFVDDSINLLTKSYNLRKYLLKLS